MISLEEFQIRDLVEILSTADVCVNPDRPSEMNDLSTMIKIMEYMALGKPIVQFDSKEGRFSAQEASLYASKDDGVANFAAKIVWLLDKPEERKKMGEIGRKENRRTACMAVFSPAFARCIPESTLTDLN